MANSVAKVADSVAKNVWVAITPQLSEIFEFCFQFFEAWGEGKLCCDRVVCGVSVSP